VVGKMFTILDPEVKYPDIVKVLTIFILILLAICPLFWKTKYPNLLVYSINFFALLFAGLRTFEILLYHRNKKIKNLLSVLTTNFVIFFTIGFGVGMLFYLLYLI